MKELNCVTFGADRNMNVEKGGSKEAYDVERGAYIDNGIDIGDIEIGTSDIIPSQTNPNIMNALMVNLKNRVTSHALQVKEEMIRKDDNIRGE